MDANTINGIATASHLAYMKVNQKSIISFLHSMITWTAKTDEKIKTNKPIGKRT
jgi:hypothetical protein